ncbi:MAG: hypothetical protein LBJ64_05055 [Deltaproteobacteria bacterium]|jgi:hypothetical protein|nr:hypothetical protein [Deltaproteobacteria bacterium]
MSSKLSFLAAILLAFLWSGQICAQDSAPDESSLPPAQAESSSPEANSPDASSPDAGSAAAADEDADAVSTAPTEEAEIQNSAEGDLSAPEMTVSEEEEMKILQESALSPEIMLKEPPLTEEDMQIYFDMHTFIFFGDSPLTPPYFEKFARDRGITLRRLNYIAAKLSLPLGEKTRHSVILNELGLGVLLNREEKELFNKHYEDLQTLAQTVADSIAYPR